MRMFKGGLYASQIDCIYGPEYSIHSEPHVYERENLGGFRSYASEHLKENE